MNPDHILIEVVEEGEITATTTEEVQALINMLRKKFDTRTAITANEEKITHWFALRAMSGKMVIYFGTPETLEECINRGVPGFIQ